MGPSVGCDWSCHSVDPAPEPTSDLLCCLFWPLPPHTSWLLFYGWAGTLAAEGPVKRKALEGFVLQAVSVVSWPQLHRRLHFWACCWEECLGDEQWLSVSAGRHFGLKRKQLELGCCLRRDATCLVPVGMGRVQQSACLPSLVCPVLCAHSS